MKVLPLLCLFLALAACRPTETPIDNPTIVTLVDDVPKDFTPANTKAELMAAGITHVTVGETTFFIGYQQVSANNQNPIFARFDGDDQTYVRTDYETTGDDQKGYGLLWDGNANLYAVFSATGTQGSSVNDFRRFATGGWLTSYGQGGGAKVSVLAKIDPTSGTVQKATFLKAVLSSGNANTLVVRSLWLENDVLQVQADSWFSPLNPDKSRMTCQGSSPFDYSLELSADLSTVLTASAVNCQ